ncbi:MAG: YdeI/OmpD-associated family protein, partial [Bacteroidia bacterium]|nr:YdeI/OmpD-associated family protein [Bacteroidia bacterium]
METPLADGVYRLEKFPGKGGWTYAALPEVKPDPHAHFGWVRVRGSIDGYEIAQYHLMPMGDGRLFLPVKAQIRKKIHKEAGDTVHVILYADRSPVQIPEDLLLCLRDEPGAYEAFMQYSDGEKKAI